METVALPLTLESTFAAQLDGLSVPWQAAQPPAPELLILNEVLAGELGLDPAALRTPVGLALLTGTALPADARPVAQGYAGHQFGGYSPRLGDGRALLVGELIDQRGIRRDLHLKGSGATPFSRGGDGKAAVGPMMREYVISEAMHALGIPTTRSLAVVATGEHVHREFGALPGALLVRVAASHLRVGSFQYASALQKKEPDLLRRLADYAIARHHPAAAEAAEPYLALLDTVISVQAELVARWMCAGFVHGVMNTDNVTISGESIDYGPCAFMEAYDPATVFSSIDHGGRYAYGNQPAITLWNLSRFAEALLPLAPAEQGTDAAIAAATAVLEEFAPRFGRAWLTGMLAKLGLPVAGDAEVPDADESLLHELLALMHSAKADWTSTWRYLADLARGQRAPADAVFAGEGDFGAWATRWLARLSDSPGGAAAAATAMDAVNPVYIPRNHVVEEALDAATEGDLEPVRRLLDVLSDPFTPRRGLERYADPAPPGGLPHQTFCGT